MPGLRLRHLGPVSPRECSPLGCRRGSLREFHRLNARREVGEPDIEPVSGRELRLRNTAWRSANGTDPYSLIGEARTAQAHDAQCHCRLPVRPAGAIDTGEQAMAQRNGSLDGAALSVTHPDAAGVDIGNASHWGAVPTDRDDQPVRESTKSTPDLRRLADWLPLATWTPWRWSPPGGTCTKCSSGASPASSRWRGTVEDLPLAG